MPAFLTHWHVLIETARRSQDAGSDLGSLIMNRAELQQRMQGMAAIPLTPPAGAVWHTGPLPAIDASFPGSDISAMAFLGALAPDMTSYLPGYTRWQAGARDQELPLSAPADGSIPWHRLLHINRSGDVILMLLERIAEVPAPALRSQMLAFAMGYLSHIATDIALNPYLAAIASACQPDGSQPPGPATGVRFSIEQCLDEMLAASYFEHRYTDWLKRPWGDYIEPAAHAFLNSSSLTAPTLELLLQTMESVYGLNEIQGQLLRRDYRAGVQRLRRYLAGRGSFRWLARHDRRNKREDESVRTLLAAPAGESGALTLEEMLGYAIRLSERFCRRAISYYASLRNMQATAQERNERRELLHQDLRNWNLYTGYAMEVAFDQQVTVRFLHNWIHFSDV